MVVFGRSQLFRLCLCSVAWYACSLTHRAEDDTVGAAELLMEKEDTMLAEPKTELMTPEEYLSMERKAVYKNEYLQGEIYPMPGASREHNLIVASILARL